MAPLPRRRLLLWIIAVGTSLICLTVAYYDRVLSIVFQLFSPRVEVLSDRLVDAGPVSEYRDPGVYTKLKTSHGIWVVHEPGGTLYALSTICTHLGCTPDWKAKATKFVCPCHGSEYDATGLNIKGPTKRPLERLKVVRLNERLYIDKETVFHKENGEWNHSDAAIDLQGD